ncbi:MAG: hypothetical protein KAR06_10275, partial [Deltaproteobacteria bacterium]|nr:hypothetical protein [Deltaproteobacteria bacterium]
STKIQVEVDGKYNTNVFLLKSSKKNDVDSPTTAEEISGRYNDMGSSSDIVIKAQLKLSASGPSPFGKKAKLGVNIEPRYYLQNTAASYVKLNFNAQQDTGNKGLLKLNLEFVPSRFKKNYLTDTLTTANVADDERVYDAGVTTDTEVSLVYARKLSKDLDFEAGFGLTDRNYDSPFTGRDRSGWFIPIKLTYDLKKNMALGLNYTYSNIDNDVHSEVIILDETLYGIDINGNTSIDPDSRVIANIDRSFTSNEIGVFTKIKMANNAKLKLAYDLRFRSYSSAELYDESHNNRDDTRHKLSALLSLGSVNFGIERTTQNSNKGTDATGSEETSYARTILSINYGYRF